MYVPSERLLFLSEAYNDRVFPLLRSGFPSEWLDVLDRAAAMDVERYVAGHGVRGSADHGRAGLLRYRDAVERVVRETTRLHAAGVGVDEAAAQAELGELESWADYSSQAERAVRRVYAELNGELPPPLYLVTPVVADRGASA